MKPVKIFGLSVIGSMTLAINLKALVDWVFHRNTLSNCLKTFIASLVGAGFGYLAIFLLMKFKWFNKPRTAGGVKNPWLLVLAMPVIYGGFVYFTSVNAQPNITPGQQVVPSLITALLLIPWSFYLVRLQQQAAK